MRIAIRADGGRSIGMGHIIRTLVLAKELSKKNEVFYVCKFDNYENSFPILQNSKFVRELNEITSFGSDFMKLISEKYRKGIEKLTEEKFKVYIVREDNLIHDLKNIKADLLVTDSYDVDESYFFETKKIFNKTAYIDDMNLHYFDVDYLINQNLGSEEINYKVSENTKLLLGIKYTLLRDEFRNLNSRVVKPKVNDIMITIGGADPYNITYKILEWVKDLDFIFHVVIGPSFRNDTGFEKFKSNKIRFYYNADMASIMQMCDIAVTACGSTVYELCACGVPAIGIALAENQVKLAKEMHALKIIKFLGWYYEIDKDCFINSILSVAEDYLWRKSACNIGSSIVDGKGVYRICDELDGTEQEV